MKILFINDRAYTPQLEENREYDIVIHYSRDGKRKKDSSIPNCDSLAEFDDGEFVSVRNIDDAFETMAIISSENTQIYTSTILNFSSRMDLAIKRILPILEEGAVIITENEGIDTSTNKFKEIWDNIIKGYNVYKKAWDEECVQRRKAQYRQITYQEFENFDELFIKYYYNELKKKDFAKEIGVSRPTLDKLIDEFKKKNVIVRDKIITVEEIEKMNNT